jgi:hypothetical protein
MVWLSTAQLDCVHHAGELCKHTVPRGVYESATVLFDEPVDYRAMCRQGADRRFFVLPHEATVAMDVGTKDSGEFAFHIHLSAHHPAWDLIVSIAHSGGLGGCEGENNSPPLTPNPSSV